MAGTEQTLLEARIRDAAQKCDKGTVAAIPFLDPRNCKLAERCLRTAGLWDTAWFWGGYPDAERKTLFLLPDYLAACLPQSPMSCTPDEVSDLIEEDVRDAVSALCITGSGFRTLSHRDYLGSILALGVERSALGDIAVQNTREAVLFCSATMATFLQENLTRVAADTVKTTPYTLDEHFTDGRHYECICDTVASERLDCVIAALCNLSREAAQALVRSDAVEVDFEPVSRVDLTVYPPATISVRGYGRFILRAYEGETRKGRLRLRADRLV